MTLEQELQTRPEFRRLNRPYGPGKFYTFADAYVYALSLEGCDETEQDGDTSYTLIQGPFEHPDLRPYTGVMLWERSDGIVKSRWFVKSDGNLMDREWERVCNGIAADSDNETE
jgi:hypothetical protein